MPDLINQPPHYNQGSIECVDYIVDQDFDYCLGNAIKYITRCRHKGHPVEDLRKAIVYINFYIDKVAPCSGDASVDNLH